jgi:hypothetical protein
MKRLPIETPPGFGVRQPFRLRGATAAGALASHGSRLKSGRGLPQSKTQARGAGAPKYSHEI